MNGVEHLLGVSFRQTLGCYVKSSPMLSISKGTSTLHDAFTLLLVLFVQPALVLAAMLLEAWKYATRIGDGAGTISMLAWLDDGRSVVFEGVEGNETNYYCIT